VQHGLSVMVNTVRDEPLFCKSRVFFSLWPNFSYFLLLLRCHFLSLPSSSFPKCSSLNSFSRLILQHFHSKFFYFSFFFYLSHKFFSISPLSRLSLPHLLLINIHIFLHQFSSTFPSNLHLSSSIFTFFLPFNLPLPTILNLFFSSSSSPLLRFLKHYSHSSTHGTKEEK